MCINVKLFLYPSYNAFVEGRVVGGGDDRRLGPLSGGARGRRGPAFPALHQRQHGQAQGKR